MGELGLERVTFGDVAPGEHDAADVGILGEVDHGRLDDAGRAIGMADPPLLRGARTGVPREPLEQSQGLGRGGLGEELGEPCEVQLAGRCRACARPRGR